MWNSIEKVLKLQHESSALKKQEILREYKDDETFCKLLYYALNPMLTYKISEATLRKPVKYRSDITLILTRHLRCVRNALPAQGSGRCNSLSSVRLFAAL